MEIRAARRCCCSPACTWQLNFRNVADDLAAKYHIIAVNYDGFEGAPDIHEFDMKHEVWLQWH